MKRGRTFLSGGPLLEFSIDGARTGDTVSLAAGGGTVEVVASAQSIIPIHTLQIVHNGQVVAQTDEPAGACSLKLNTRLQVTEHSWLCARDGAPNYDEPVAHHDVWQRGVFAHTSPIYVACGGEWQRSDPAGLQYLLTLVDGSLEYMRQIPPRHAPGTVTRHHGEDDHQVWLERPFLEARAALTERLRATG